MTSPSPPPDTMTGDELLDEHNLVERLLANPEDWEKFTHEAFERQYALRAELQRRLKLYDDSKATDHRAMIESFAGSASYAVVSLWAAHRGKPLTETQQEQFTRMLFQFFLEAHQGDPKTGCENEKA